MSIANVKRWQWVAMSLVVGPMLAFMNSLGEPGAGLVPTSAPEFEQNVLRHDVPGDLPRIKNIVVYPAEVGANGTPVYLVTLDEAVFDSANKGWNYKKSKFEADVPYVSYNGNGRHMTAIRTAHPDKSRTILTALNEIVAKNPTVKYQYAWWEEPKWSYGLWTAGSVLVIGGIWPVLLSLLVGAGLGPKVEEKEYDLERFGKSEEEEVKPEPVKKEMSEEDRDKLTEQLDRLEKNIGSAAVMTDVPAPSGVMAAGPAPIRQLSGGPVEVAVGASKEDEDKEYKGEFYPVAKSGQGKG
ncbi:MAG TPA: hypothetical protein VFE58_15195 [Tepidisphaeraceae bacterium]|jgi:hypothetical protein|nr:hypothetical protein [Tepidisphaeraceae bacterium]